MSTQISANPFKHMSNGTKKLAKTNLVNVVVLHLLFLGACFIFVLLLAGVLRTRLHHFTLSPDELLNELWSVLFIVLGMGLAFGLTIGIIFETATNKLFLSGVRDTKKSLGQAFSFARERYSLVLQTGLLLVGMFVGWFVLSAILGKLAPVLVFVATLALLVAVIVFITTLMVLPFVLVDNAKPVSAVAALKQSNEIAKSISGKLWLMVLVTIVFGVIVGSIFGNSDAGYHRSTTHPSYTYSANYSLIETPPAKKKSRGMNAAGNLIMSVYSLVLTAGIAELYSLAKSSTGKKEATTV